MVRKTIPTHDEDPATENNQGALRVDQTSRQHLIVTETVCDRKQTKTRRLSLTNPNKISNAKHEQHPFKNKTKKSEITSQIISHTISKTNVSRITKSHFIRDIFRFKKNKQLNPALQKEASTAYHLCDLFYNQRKGYFNF